MGPHLHPVRQAVHAQQLLNAALHALFQLPRIAVPHKGLGSAQLLLLHRQHQHLGGRAGGEVLGTQLRGRSRRHEQGMVHGSNEIRQLIMKLSSAEMHFQVRSSPVANEPTFLPRLSMGSCSVHAVSSASHTGEA